MRTSEHIRAEIEQAFGFFPPFFEPALPTPQVLESLWQQTRAAYVDSPLPALFKERLNASLSRFCAVPYCMVCHSSALRPLGMKANEVLALLETPPPVDSEVEGHLAALGDLPILISDFPVIDSPQELALIACATVVFLKGQEEKRCQERLASALGPELYNSLCMYLAYIKTCHTWLEMHPDISYEEDQRAKDCLGLLLAEAPALGDFFRDYREKVGTQRFDREERKAAAEVKQAGERTHAILERITDAFYALDTEWRFTYVNIQAERMFHRTKEELLGKIVWDEFPEAVETEVYAHFNRAVAEGVTVAFEVFYVPLDIWFNVHAYPSSDGLTVYLQNDNDLKAAEEYQRQQESQRADEERNRLIVDAIPHIAWTTGPDGAVDYYNRRWYDYSGLTFEETEAWGWEKVLHPDDVARAGSVWQANIEAGTPSEVEYRLRHKDGTYRLHLGRSEPVRSGGKIIRWVGTATDIEDRRVAEDAARIAHVQTAEILESIGDAFYSLDREWRFTYVNAAAEKIIRRTREELLGKYHWDVFPEGVGTTYYHLYHRVMDEKIPLSIEDYYAPLEAWVDVQVYPFADGISLFSQNVTERKAAEQAVLEANRRTTHILESITDAFFTLDHEWRFSYVNDQAEHIIFRTREEILGHTIWEVFPETIGSSFEHAYRRTASERIPVVFEEFYPPLNTWFEVRSYPSPDGISVFFQRVNERKEAEQALRQSEERYRLMVEGAKDYAMILLDTQGCITGWNSGAALILGWTEAEVVGKPIDFIFMPEDRETGVVALKMSRAVTDGRTIDLRWRVKKDGTPFYSDGSMECLRDDSGQVRGFVKILRDVTESKQAQDALRASEERLRVVQSRLEGALMAGRVGTWSWDLMNNRIFADAEFARLYSLTPEQAAGGPHEACYLAIHPDDLPRMSSAVSDSLANGDTYEVDYRVVLPDGSHRWVTARGKVERNADGAPITLAGMVADVTERVEREQRDRLLAEIAQEARRLTDPDEVIADAMQRLGKFLGVSRCLYADIDIDADICTIPANYCADDSVVSMVGAFPISAFGPYLVNAYREGSAVVVDDMGAESARIGAEYAAAYEAVSCRAFIAAPFLHSDRIVSVISVHCVTPRRWEPEEIELVKTVVERIWLTVEVTRQEHALQREIQEVQRADARMRTILESISDAFYALDTDWRFTYVNTQAEALLRRTREELVGKYMWDEFPEGVGTKPDLLYRRAVAEGVVLTFEEYYVPLTTWFEVRAYPSSEGLSIYFHDISERKAQETARERIAERERNIAEQLQAALTPTVPERIPGMAIAKYYKAALDEAGVGGDFYDIFMIDTDRPAIVVGDLSGKGLAAAAQVATVRHMLRYALYRARSIVGALTSLNTLLAQQKLLTGFATLFVGTYDSNSGVLTYVNCGQEPALVRRGAGTVEHLLPTGPILGSFAGMDFAESAVALAPGDAVVVFTDGLTEVGRSRTEMFGVEGVAALLEQSVLPAEADGAEAMAEYLACRLIAGVDAAAQDGVTRDDMCLLVGVVE